MLLSGNFAEGGWIALAKQALPPAGACPCCQNNRAALGRRDDSYDRFRINCTIGSLALRKLLCWGVATSSCTPLWWGDGILVSHTGPGWIWHFLKFHLRSCNDRENRHTGQLLQNAVPSAWPKGARQPGGSTAVMQTLSYLRLGFVTLFRHCRHRNPPEVNLTSVHLGTNTTASPTVP